MHLIALLIHKSFNFFYELCNNCRPLDRTCGKSNAFKDRTDKIKDILALVNKTCEPYLELV